MFETARLKLTAWYALIIMLVSLSFSVFIYNGVSSEFQRRLNVIETRLRSETPLNWRAQGPVHAYFVQDLNEARAKVILILLYANGVIFVFSAVLGNYLAGKALQPIEIAMDEQKRFVSDASHELKTPLTALQTSIEVALRDKKLKLSDAKSALYDSLNDVSRLTDLTNNLLSLARYEQNDAKTKMMKVNVMDVLGQAVKNTQPLADKKNVELKLATKKIKLKGNENDLIKLFTILLDNAIKYTPKKGKINLSTSMSNNKKTLIVKVKDNGIGISKKDLPNIFDRFFRADQSRTQSKTEGFGLGLSMAKKIVVLHGGKIGVRSKMGKGSTFTVKLPI